MSEIDYVKAIARVEERLELNTLEPENSGAVRFCVSQILLKAIALSKNPANNPDRVHDLFDLAAEIVAQGDLKTNVESARLTDLINAIVERDDIGITVKNIVVQTNKRFDLLEEKLRYDASIAKEERDTLSLTLGSIQKIAEKGAFKGSTLRTFFAILLALSILIFSIITSGATIAYYMANASQPDYPRLQKDSYTNSTPRLIPQRQFYEEFDGMGRLYNRKANKI